MPTSTHLIEFIESTANTSQEWDQEQWRQALNKNIPNWQVLIEDQATWNAISAFQFKGKSQVSLYRALVNGIDPQHLELPFLLLDSSDGILKGIILNWVGRHFNSAMWCQLNTEQKRLVLEKKCHLLLNNLEKYWPVFDDSEKRIFLTALSKKYPGEPLCSLQSLNCWAIDQHKQPDSFVGFWEDINIIIKTGGYIQDEIFDDLCLCLEDEQDTSYLAILDDLAAQQEAQCHTAWAELIAQKPVRFAVEEWLVDWVKQLTLQNGYAVGALPPVYLSFDQPPFFKNNPGLEVYDFLSDDGNDSCSDEHDKTIPETFSIDNLLCEYQPSRQSMTLYLRGIVWTCERMRYFEPEFLAILALVHGIGHWVSQQLPMADSPCWPADSYQTASPEVHEGWAQLFTWWFVNAKDFPQYGCEAFIEDFENLNQKQPATYQVFKDFKKIPPKKIFASLAELRKLVAPATLQDWKRILGLE